MPNPTDKHVGARVRMRRLMLDMSQTTLAAALGLSFQQVPPAARPRPARTGFVLL
jgi:transcriptional regulator with XRE-family HTH domain